MSNPTDLSGNNFNNDYSSKDIQIKEGIEHVRARPAMYIGNTGEEGLHHLIYEVLDNSIDEALGGFCNHISVRLQKDHVVEVSDDGRGIPVEIHKQTNTSTLEVVMTRLGAGGKFENKAYKVSGGLHGVGVSVVNGLSEWCEAVVERNGYKYYQKYELGCVTDQVKVIGNSENTGTTIRFKPDKQIFEEIYFDFDKLIRRFRELAFLNKGVTITAIDERDEESINEQVYHYEGGLVSFIEMLNENKESIHPGEIIYFKSKKNDVEVEMAIEYNSGFQETILSYVNNIYTREGGTHLAGMKSALTKVMNEFLKRMGLDKKIRNSNLDGEDVREGLTTVLSIKHKSPQFEGQTKMKLGNHEVKGIVESVITEALKIFFEEHPKVTKAILEKCIIGFNARRAAQMKRDSIRKGYMERGSLPGKLADCSEKNPALCELYIVEGDSAGGSAKLGRSRDFQAILPLWGKMLNVEKTRLENALENDKLQPIIATLGAGIGKDFKLHQLRYHKIIIMADADVDGSHIRTLLLTFFYRYFLQLVEEGYIYIAMPPLYKIQVGKKIQYAYNDKERNEIIEQFPNRDRVQIQRYKGLGEMNPDQLWDTTMQPKTRSLIQITAEDAILADQMFTKLMSEKVEPRRQFIEQYAQQVKNIDV